MNYDYLIPLTILALMLLNFISDHWRVFDKDLDQERDYLPDALVAWGVIRATHEGNVHEDRYLMIRLPSYEWKADARYPARQCWHQRVFFIRLRGGWSVMSIPSQSDVDWMRLDGAGCMQIVCQELEHIRPKVDYADNWPEWTDDPQISGPPNLKNAVIEGDLWWCGEWDK